MILIKILDILLIIFVIINKMSHIINFLFNACSDFLDSFSIPSRYSLIKQKGLYNQFNTKPYIQLANLH
jgi:hypothetical protein